MASPSLPLIIGSFGLNELPALRDASDSTKRTLTRVWNGTYSQCEAAEPAIGTTFSDLPGEVIVVRTLVEKMPGGKGHLTIDFETPYETTYECEWVEVDKLLIENPRYWCQAAGDLADGPFKLTPQDRAMIERWEQEENAVLRMFYLFKMPVDATTASSSLGLANPVATWPFTATGFEGATLTLNAQPTIAGIQYNIYQLSSNAQDYATKRLRGQEQYRLFAPVVRETSESFDAPTAVQGGILENPPTEAGEVVPRGYLWQRSAARVVRTGPYGKYRLQREWQGADYIDGDLYTALTTGY